MGDGRGAACQDTRGGTRGDPQRSPHSVGLAAGLSREWRVGEWSVAPGQLALDGIDVRVLSVVAGLGRSAPFGKSLAGEHTRVVTLRTATAELEWSNSTYLEATALRCLAVPDARP